MIKLIYHFSSSTFNGGGTEFIKSFTKNIKIENFQQKKIFKFSNERIQLKNSICIFHGVHTIYYYFKIFLLSQKNVLIIHGLPLREKNFFKKILWIIFMNILCLKKLNYVFLTKTDLNFYKSFLLLDSISYCIIPNFVDIKKDTYTKKNKIFDLIWAGRDCFQKNPEKAIRIFNTFKKGKFLMIGLKNKKYKKNIIYKNWLGKKKLYEYLSQSKGLLITSRYEGMSLLILEALCLGVPVYATRFVGLRDLLDLNCYINVINQNNFHKIFHNVSSKNILKHFNDRNFYIDNFGAGSRQLVWENFLKNI